MAHDRPRISQLPQVALSEAGINQLLVQLDTTYRRVEASKSSKVKLPAAELELLTCLEQVRNTLQMILSPACREELKRLFGGSCTRTARIHVVLDAVSLSPANAGDQRLVDSRRACESVEEILKDLGLGEALRAAQKAEKDALAKSISEDAQALGPREAEAAAPREATPIVQPSPPPAPAPAEVAIADSPSSAASAEMFNEAQAATAPFTEPPAPAQPSVTVVERADSKAAAEAGAEPLRSLAAARDSDVQPPAAQATQPSVPSAPPAAEIDLAPPTAKEVETEDSFDSEGKGLKFAPAPRVGPDISQALRSVAAARPLCHTGAVPMCKVGCLRMVAPGVTRKGKPFDTCCRGCALGRGHNELCGHIDPSKVGPGLCKMGCGLKVAEGRDSSGQILDTCCRGCATGTGHNSLCGQQVGDETVPYAKIDEDPFFADARRTLGLVEYNALVEEVRLLNRRKTTLEQCLEKGCTIIGADHPDLQAAFIRLLAPSI